MISSKHSQIDNDFKVCFVQVWNELFGATPKTQQVCGIQLIGRRFWDKGMEFRDWSEFKLKSL